MTKKDLKKKREILRESLPNRGDFLQMAHKRKVKRLASTAEAIHIIELPNGLTVAHKYIPYTQTVHCGYIFNAGSRDDGPDRRRDRPLHRTHDL